MGNLMKLQDKEETKLFSHAKRVQYITMLAQPQPPMNTSSLTCTLYINTHTSSHPCTLYINTHTSPSHPYTPLSSPFKTFALWTCQRYLMCDSSQILMSLFHTHIQKQKHTHTHTFLYLCNSFHAYTGSSFHKSKTCEYHFRGIHRSWTGLKIKSSLL